MKLLDRLIRYEHKEWIKLHKLHLSAASVAVLAVAVITGVVFADSKPTTAAQPQAQSPVTSNQTSQNSPVATTTQPSNVTTNSSTPATSASPTNASTPTYKAAPVAPSKSSAPSTSSQVPSPTQQPTSPATPSATPPIQPLSLTQQYPDDYPSQWATPTKDSVIDTWQMYNRESVSYTAWKVNETFTTLPQPFPFNGQNANSWVSVARTYHAQGYPVNVTSIPAVHEVGIQNNVSAPGFSVWVEAVDTTNNTVTVSSYNDGATGEYNVKVMPATSFQYIQFGN